MDGSPASLRLRAAIIARTSHRQLAVERASPRIGDARQSGPLSATGSAARSSGWSCSGLATTIVPETGAAAFWSADHCESSSAQNMPAILRDAFAPPSITRFAGA